MSLGAQTTTLLDDLSRLSRRQWLLRSLPAACTATFLLLVSVAGGTQSVPGAVVAVVLCVVVVALPDSGAALGLLVVLVGLWLLRVPEQLGGWTLVAGLDLLVLHVVVALASYGPPSAVLERALVAAWVRRGLALAAVTLLAWSAARLLAALDLSAAGWLMASGLAVLLVWSGYLMVRLDSSSLE